MCTMNKLLKDVAGTGSRCGNGILGTGLGDNNNIIVWIFIILILCGCCGGGNVLGAACVPGRRIRRRRRRGAATSRISPIILIALGALIAGTNQGRNVNTNIINLDTDDRAGEDLIEL